MSVAYYIACCLCELGGLRISTFDHSAGEAWVVCVNLFLEIWNCENPLSWYFDLANGTISDEVDFLICDVQSSFRNFISGNRPVFMLLNLTLNHASLTNQLLINFWVEEWIIWGVEHTCAGILKSVFVLNIELFTSLMTRVKVFWFVVECLCLVKHLVVSNCFLFEKIGRSRV